MQNKRLNRVGAALVLLTLSSFALGERGVLAVLPVLAILTITLGKGWLVIDEFMALRRVKGPFRWLVRGWLLGVLLLIGVAFCLGQLG